MSNNGNNDDFDIDKFNIDDVNTEDYEPDGFKPTELLEINDDKNKDFGINVVTKVIDNDHVDISVEGRHAFRSNKFRDKATEMFKTDKDNVLESIKYVSKSFKLNTPETATINIGISLLDALHLVLNSYSYTDNRKIIDELKRLLTKVGIAIVKGRPKEVGFYIKDFKKQFNLLKKIVTLRGLQRLEYFKAFSRIVIHYVIIYKRMIRLSNEQLKKMLK